MDDEQDQPTPPTAAELGISEAEYARILRGLDARHGGGPPLDAGPDAGSPGTPPERRRRAGRVSLSVLVGAVVVLGVLPRLGGGSVADGPAYTFLAANGDDPVTYTSCRPIQVAIYPAGGPPDAEQLVREAVARMRVATGLDIVITGTFGGHAPNWNFEAGPTHPEDPISVSWQDGAAIEQLTDHTAGLGGSRQVTNPDGTQRLVAGTIALSRDYYAYLSQRGDRGEALSVLLHEFGHVFGLGHVDDPDELMYADNSQRTDFGPGDLAGLRRLGQGPCV